MPTEPMQEDSRLGRAAELAAFLRDNPSQSRCDPEDLARKFGIDATLVSQIQISTRIKPPRTKRADRRAYVKQLAATGKLLASRAFENPYLFQLVAGAICVAMATFIPNGGISIGFVLWAVTQVMCSLARPKFRHALFGTALLWIGVGVMDEPSFRHQKMPFPFDSRGGHILFDWLLGMSCAIFNLFFTGILVVVGSALHLAIQRKKDASLSRQDLLSRMFFLQERLQSLPARNLSVAPSGRIAKFSQSIRSRPFPYVLCTFLVLHSLDMLVTLAFHIDPGRLHETTQTITSVGGNKIAVGSASAPSKYIAIQMGISILRTVSAIYFGFTATTWRKVGQVVGAIALATAVTWAWGWPVGALGTLPAAAILGVFAGAVATASALILLVRFSVGFNRILAGYRVGTVLDEASMVSELLEIRYRLSANPAQVCVLVVDAAGSTQMKRNADPLLVEFSFGQYQNWIAETVLRHGGKVEITTGDGAICAFGQAENALATAQQLQAGVDDLNARHNRLASPFRLRIALHAGKVVADLDKVQFTEVIDVAAHVEKFSPVGGIALTAPFLSALPNLPSLTPIATTDGVDVFTMPASRSVDSC